MWQLIEFTEDLLIIGGAMIFVGWLLVTGLIALVTQRAHRIQRDWSVGRDVK